MDENLIEVHISVLRRRLGAGARDLIQTLRGVGYVLRDRSPTAPSSEADDGLTPA